MINNLFLEWAGSHVTAGIQRTVDRVRKDGNLPSSLDAVKLLAGYNSILDLWVANNIYLTPIQSIPAGQGIMDMLEIIGSEICMNVVCFKPEASVIHGSSLFKGTKGRVGDIPLPIWLKDKIKDQVVFQNDLDINTILTDDRAVFPLKTHPAVRTKVNLFFRDVLADFLAVRRHDTAEIKKFCGCLTGLANDTATAALMWFMIVREQYPVHAWSIVWLIRSYQEMKSLNDLIKAAGVLSHTGLRLFAEMGPLLGRMGTSVDVEADIRGRVNISEFTENKVAKIDLDELRVALREIKRHELPVTPVWHDPQTHWNKRWAYTKSGSHSKRIERLKLGGSVTQPGQVTRRMFAESVDQNMIAYGRPSVHAGVSLKLEAPKTRVIYGCDSISYYTFDYLLQPIEREWLGNRVLLRPSKGDALQDYVSWSRLLSSYSLMLDYEDFNSQHSTEAMKLVFEVLCEDGPAEQLKWCMDSFDNSYIWDSTFCPDGVKSVGTLFSGHRATSFINSILNAAYLRVAVGRDFWRTTSLHTGDDVLVTSNDANLIDGIVKNVLDGRLRINPSKQSLGQVNAEFLRVSFNKDGGTGYLCRAIGSLVSGNWVSLKQLDELEYIDSMLAQAWTLRMRSGSDLGPMGLLSTFKRRAPELAYYAEDLLRARVSFNGSPVIGREGNRFTELVCDISVSRSRSFSDMKAHATQDYLDNCVDSSLLDKTGITRGQLKRLMLEASYKGESEADKRIVSVTTGIKRIASQMTYSGGRFLKRSGVLEKLFPLSFMRGLVDLPLTKSILVGLGYALEADVMDQAWGTRVHSIRAESALPYSTARSLGRVVNCVTSFYCYFPLAL